MNDELQQAEEALARTIEQERSIALNGADDQRAIHAIMWQNMNAQALKWARSTIDAIKGLMYEHS